jgi:hypothetical protein
MNEQSCRVLPSPSARSETVLDRMQQIIVHHIGDGERQIMLITEHVLPGECRLEPFGLAECDGLDCRQLEVGGQFAGIDDRQLGALPSDHFCISRRAVWQL